MSYSIESPSQTKRTIAFSVEATNVNAAINATLRELAKEINLDGFRKGKVPHSVIEKRYSEDVYNRATESIINSTVTAALEEANLLPINRVQLADEEKAELAKDETDAEALNTAKEALSKKAQEVFSKLYEKNAAAQNTEKTQEPQPADENIVDGEVEENTPKEDTPENEEKK